MTKITKRMYVIVRTESPDSVKPTTHAKCRRHFKEEDLGASDNMWTWKYLVTENLVLEAATLFKDPATLKLIDWSFEVDPLLEAMKRLAKAEFIGVIGGGMGSVNVRWESGHKEEDKKATVSVDIEGIRVTHWWEILWMDVEDHFEE